MKELLLVLKGMNRPELKGSLVNYGEFCKLVNMLLLEIAPEKVEEATRKLKDFDSY